MVSEAYRREAAHGYDAALIPQACEPRRARMSASVRSREARGQQARKHRAALKIAVWYNIPSGGAKRALFDHVRGLVARGHTVEAWCPSTADRTYLPLRSVIVEHVDAVTWRDIKSRRLRYHEIGSAIALSRRLKAMDDHGRRCAREMNARGFDVMLASSCRFFGSPHIARHARMPTVLYLQEPHRQLYEALPKLPWVALSSAQYWSAYSPRFLRHWLADLVATQVLRVQAREELRNAQAFTSILVNSLFSRESVLRAYGIEARPCYLGVDTEMFVDRHQPRDAFVVGVGSFTRAKNLHFVIEALGRLSPRAPRLVWIGNIVDDDYLSELAALAARLHVTFEPRIRATDAEIVELLNRASLMAYAPRLEPFGFAPIEANACGLPVVGVAEGGLRETIIDGVNGVVCEPEPEAMAKAIQRLLDDPVYARQLGANGRALVEERWSLEAAIDRLEAQLLGHATPA